MKVDTRLDYVAFGVKFGSGHLYFDRCGQCLLDIERYCPGWGATSVDIQTGQIENPDKFLSANFNNKEFNFTSQKAHKLPIEEIASEISSVWRVIQANFAIEEFVRVGVRFNYILPTDSTESSEIYLKRSELQIVLPKLLQTETYSIKNRQVILVLTKDDTEYRIELAGVTRHEGINPTEIIRTDPRLLSKHQKDIRMAKLKQLSEYNANPMFAVSLNIDCAVYSVVSISIEDLILKNADLVKSYFLPILTNQ